MTRILGLDPGVTGGWALMIDAGMVCVGDIPVQSIGSTKQINARELSELFHKWNPDVVVLEDNRANGVNGSKANYSMGLSMGVCIGVAGAHEVKLVRTRPQDWKKAVGIGSVKGTASDRKEASRGRAIELWPAMFGGLRRKMDHNRAEAMLLAESYRRGLTH